MYYSIDKNGQFLLSVKVIPNAMETESAGVVGDSLKIRVHAPPEKGRANAELVAFLAARLNIPKTAIEIVRGRVSSSKLLRLSGVDAGALPLV